MRKFHCQCCGNCCRWKGIVRLTSLEPERLAKALDISVEEFVDRYTDLAPDRTGLILKCLPDGACCFLTADNLCAVNAVKPVQCAGFPYTWQPTAEQAPLCHGYWSDEPDQTA